MYFVETESEEMYYGCMDLYWADAKREDRSEDFFIIENGKLKRISKKLADEFSIPCTPVSLDALFEDSGYEPFASSDTEAEVFKKLREEAIMKKAFEAGHNIFVIVGHLLENPKYPEKELMKELGIAAQTTVNYQKKKALAIIEEECGKWL